LPAKPKGNAGRGKVSLADIEIHLSEHHGAASPGAHVLIEDFPALAAYHKRLLLQQYKYNKPGLEKAFFNPALLLMEVIDAFGNRLTFTGK
jgi:Glyoxalase superfamily protein